MRLFPHQLTKSSVLQTINSITPIFIVFARKSIWTLANDLSWTNDMDLCLKCVKQTKLNTKGVNSKKNRGKDHKTTLPSLRRHSKNGPLARTVQSVPHPARGGEKHIFIPTPAAMHILDLAACFGAALSLWLEHCQYRWWSSHTGSHHESLGIFFQ